MPESIKMFPTLPQRRSFFYIDGFNLYYGIFERRPEWKWLNIGKFCQSLRPVDAVRVNYFTAIIDEDRAHSPIRDRQTKYLDALGTLPNFEIVKGTFQRRTMRCRADCCREYYEPKEKKTDVNIAVRIIDNCIYDTPDEIVVISSDSDLEPVVAWVRRRYPQIVVTVYLPNLPNSEGRRRNDFYKSIGVRCIDLPCGRIPDSQFNTAVKVGPGTFVQRPEEWVKDYQPN